MIKTIKENIKYQIKQNKTTAGKVCFKLNKDRRYIYVLTDNVALYKIIDIAHAIGCKPSELLEGS